MVKINSLLFFVVLVAVITVNMLGTAGCANMAPPTGGPRDSLPPRLVSAKPPDSARNFNSKKFNLEFDEFVQLDNTNENLLVSPTPKIPPLVESKLRTVTVTIKDTLEPNTTYSIDFGNAIKDINEGNVYKNFRYVFSTGHAIDSLEVSGKVIIAETGKSDSTLIVMLHTHLDDSAVIKEKPRYVARLDPTGSFHFRNLPPGTFAIYALKDEGGQRKYMSQKQLFAFADSPVNTEKPGSITLYAYLERDTVKPKPPATPAKTTKPSKEEKDKKLRLESNLGNGVLDLLDTLKFSFRQAPLKEFDSSRIRLTTDKYEPIKGYRIVKDTGNQHISIFNSWVENTPYNLIFEKEFATDTAGRTLTQTDTIAFRTKKESEYGLVRLRLLNLDLSKDPVLQFVQAEQVKYSYRFVTREFYAKLFVPGEYELRILYDANKNGVWDPGEFFGKHIQPEKVQPLSRKLNVKANWDNEVDITL